MQSNVDLCPRWSRSNSYRPPPPPFSGYLFPELRYISLVLISRTNITFFHYIQREFPIRLPAGYFRLWTRDREIPRREITCRKSAVFTWNVCKFFYCGQSRRNFRGISIGNRGTLFEKRFVFRYSTACRESNCKINILEN